jgi:hypothetical protein
MPRSRGRAIAALFIAGLLAVAVTGIATAGVASDMGVNQTLDVDVSKTKVVKNAEKGIPATPVDLGLGVAVDTDAGTMPPAAEKVELQLAESDEIIIDTTGIKDCSVADVENKSTADAKAACKKSQVGTGEATAVCGRPGGAFAPFEGEVVVFNGDPKGKKKVLILHAYITFPTGPVAQVLEGVLSGKNVLTFNIEELGGGTCSLQEVAVEVSKRTKVQGETHSYVGAACPDKKWKFSGDFTYRANTYGVTSLSPKETIKCKGKS